MYNIYAMHRDIEVFGPDPEEFVPERWNGLRPGWGYLPFNGGPRICIGREYPKSLHRSVVGANVPEQKSLRSWKHTIWYHEWYKLSRR